MTAPEPRKSSALKKAWVKRWNMPASPAREADGHDHVAELRERGVGEDALDVVLLGGHQRGEQRGDAADPGDDGRRRVAEAVDEEATRGPACKRRRRPSWRRG